MPSSNPRKKYQIQRPDGRWIHFGDQTRADFLRHGDANRWRSYRRRSLHIRGNWKADPYSPNNLAREILWPFIPGRLPREWAREVKAGEL